MGLAGADHILDLAVAVDVGIELPLLQGGRLEAAIDRALGELEGVAVLRPQVEVVQERVLLVAHVDEGRIEPGATLRTRARWISPTAKPRSVFSRCSSISTLSRRMAKVTSPAPERMMRSMLTR